MYYVAIVSIARRQTALNCLLIDLRLPNKSLDTLNKVEPAVQEKGIVSSIELQYDVQKNATQ